MVRIFSIAALLIGVVLFGGSVSGSPAFAMPTDAVAMERMDCEDCTNSMDMQMSDALCSSFCTISGLVNKTNYASDTHQIAEAVRFESVIFDLTGLASSPDPHPPKSIS